MTHFSRDRGDLVGADLAWGRPIAGRYALGEGRLAASVKLCFADWATRSFGDDWARESVQSARVREREEQAVRVEAVRIWARGLRLGLAFRAVSAGKRELGRFRLRTTSSVERRVCFELRWKWSCPFSFRFREAAGLVWE